MSNKQLALRTGISRRITAAQKKRFIAELTKVPSVKHAALAAGFSRRAAYDLREADEEFKEAWAAAIASSVDEVENRAFEIALRGDPQVAANLITFLLRCHKAEVYNPSTKADVALLHGLIYLPEKSAGPE
jgi:hypothetical protein